MQAEVTIRAIAAGGDGVASLPDGPTVFVPRAAVGDRIALRNVRVKGRMARGSIGAVLHPGPGRIEPPCHHYVADRCGGCQLMHLDEAAQRSARSRIAGDALRRIARLDAPDPVMHPAPQQFAYRTKVTLAMRDGRLGYRRLHEPDSIFNVTTCHIAEPVVQHLIDAMQVARRQLPSHASRVVLRRDRAGEPHVVVRTDGERAWTGGGALDRALRAQGATATVWWHPEGGQPRAVAGSESPWPATVFEQVHPAMGELVRRTAVEWLGDVSATSVWDLYAGVGETTAMLASRGAQVTSVERDRRAVELADRLGPDGPDRRAGDAADTVRRLPAPRAIVTNPPRTGMDAAVSEAIAGSGADRVVYISCDPATLARDLVRLAPAYRLARAEAFDQFPQTAHLETVALLERQ